ncbi:MAG TPA: DUF2782 domain-containing protein [Gammaproteobacteria bacterium]|nr:DUF2782 domain-containing protein [Gammaproteobacteria bacterium]
MRAILFLAVCLAAGPVLAQTGSDQQHKNQAQQLPSLQEPAPKPEPNAAPPAKHTGNGEKGKQSIEPEVTIIPGKGKEKIEQYSVNGRVYMIKVIPAKGYPYYLIDTTGNGVFDTRRGGPQPNISIPHWVIFSW